MKKFFSDLRKGLHRVTLIRMGVSCRHDKRNHGIRGKGVVMAIRTKIGKAILSLDYRRYLPPDEVEIVEVCKQSEATLQQILDEPDSGGPGWIQPLTDARAELEGALS
jgi:hypothetical protein